MNRRDEDAKLGQKGDSLELEPDLREVLGNFKSSVDAWTEASISRPREVKAPLRTNWGLVTKWALGCVVFVGTVSGGVYENHRQQEAVKVEAARVAEQQRELAAQRAKEEVDLMAKVDSDIAREVPSALEPLASLMDDNQNIGN
jgi:hypothetical protein